MTEYIIHMGARTAHLKPRHIPDDVTGYQTLRDFTEINLPPEIRDDEEKELNFINKILAKERLNARDHEYKARNDDGSPAFNGEMFLGAAVVKTLEGRYFASSNMHLPSSKTTRNCAEANASTDAAGNEGIDMQTADLWFMGGKGNINSKISILPTQAGRRNSPCGSCLDVIWKNRVRFGGSQQTRVHMLPLNDGEWNIIPDDGRRAEELAPNQVMTRTIKDLLPHVTKWISDKNGKIKKSIESAWQELSQPLTLQAIDFALQMESLIHLKELSDEKAKPKDILKAINNLMVDTLQSMAARSSVPLKEAKVAVVRLDNGEYYLGQSLENGKTLGMGTAEIDAIEDAAAHAPTGHPITDIFVMSFEEEKTRKDVHNWKTNREADVEFKMPIGAVLDRLSKAGPPGEKDKPGFPGEKIKMPKYKSLLHGMVTAATGPMVHEIALNSKADFNPKTHMISQTLNELLPMRYLSPKMDEAGAPPVSGLSVM